jgi:RNA polymerase sigma factor (sigma-70 family)
MSEIMTIQTHRDALQKRRLDFLTQHWSFINAQIRRQIRDESDAADLRQEISLVILQSSMEFGNPRHFRSWCIGVVQRLARKWRRQYALRQRLETEVGERCFGSGWSALENPERRTASLELLAQGLASIEDHNVRLLIARYVDCSTAVELAEADAQSPAAVRMRLSRARAAARRAAS